MSLSRCGSLTVDLVLKLSSTIREREVLAIFRNAVKNGMLGEFKVNPSSIVGTRPVTERTTTPPTSSSHSKFSLLVIALC